MSDMIGTVIAVLVLAAAVGGPVLTLLSRRHPRTRSTHRDDS